MRILMYKIPHLKFESSLKLNCIVVGRAVILFAFCSRFVLFCSNRWNKTKQFALWFTTNPRNKIAAYKKCIPTRTITKQKLDDKNRTFSFVSQCAQITKQNNKLQP